MKKVQAVIAVLLLVWSGATAAAVAVACTETNLGSVGTSPGAGQPAGYSCQNCPCCKSSSSQLRCIGVTNTIGELVLVATTTCGPCYNQYGGGPVWIPNFPVYANKSDKECVPVN